MTDILRVVLGGEMHNLVGIEDQQQAADMQRMPPQVAPPQAAVATAAAAAAPPAPRRSMRNSYHPDIAVPW